MTKLTDTFYVVLEPTFGKRDAQGNPRATEMKAKRLVKSRPVTNSREACVRVDLVVDSSLFEAIMPVVEMELEARDLFVNTAVEITAMPDADEPASD